MEHEGARECRQLQRPGSAELASRVVAARHPQEVECLAERVGRLKKRVHVGSLRRIEPIVHNIWTIDQNMRTIWHRPSPPLSPDWMKSRRTVLPQRHDATRRAS